MYPLLPDNCPTCLATLKSTENNLQKRGSEWAKIYCNQVQDMVVRRVARNLSDKELEDWQGPVYYIRHLAVENPKSNFTPVRIVFNSSQKSQGVSLNDCLVKGPDNYMNSLIRMLLRWRENRAVIVVDKKKRSSIQYILIMSHNTAIDCSGKTWELTGIQIYILLRK